MAQQGIEIPAIETNYSPRDPELIFDAYAHTLDLNLDMLKEKQAILDLAGGDAAFGNYCSQHGINVTTVDLEPDNWGGAANINNPQYVKGNALNLPFKDEQFDLIVSRGAVHTIDDLETLFKEAKRVLKPGGEFRFNTTSLTYFDTQEQVDLEKLRDKATNLALANENSDVEGKKENEMTDDEINKFVRLYGKQKNSKLEDALLTKLPDRLRLKYLQRQRGNLLKQIEPTIEMRMGKNPGLFAEKFYKIPNIYYILPKPPQPLLRRQ
jgi:SAM-dependent methyltransferase